MKDKDIGSLEHTMWRCQYHVVFAPKYRRMVIYGEIKQDIGRILRQLCQQKGVEIIEAELCKDHVHMLISIPPKYSVSQIMGYLKGKSSLMIFDRHANLKYKYGNRHFWARGYYVKTYVLLSKLKVEHYIEVDLDLDEMDLTSAETKASYREIKEYVQEHFGLSGSNLYIAQVKRKYGIIERDNYNLPKSDDTKQPQCPPEKEKVIVVALKHFKMI